MRGNIFMYREAKVAQDKPGFLCENADHHSN